MRNYTFCHELTVIIITYLLTVRQGYRAVVPVDPGDDWAGHHTALGSQLDRGPRQEATGAINSRDQPTAIVPRLREQCLTIWWHRFTKFTKHLHKVG